MATTAGRVVGNTHRQQISSQTDQKTTKELKPL